MKSLRPAGILISTAADRFDSMRTFYRDVLEFSVRSDRNGFINFEFGDQRITVAVHSDVKGRASGAERIIVNFATDDIDAAVDHLVAQGVTMIRMAERERWGGRVATFEDPDGNLLQLLGGT